MAGKPNHDYHLVDPSPWPAFGSVSAGIMAVGAIFWMHKDAAAIGAYAPYIFGAGLLGVLITMFGWWSEVVKEGEFGGFHTPVVQIGLRYGMILFIVSEVMFFVAWFWAYFNASLAPTPQDAEGVWLLRSNTMSGGIWPPHGIETFNPWHIPFINTLILLLSGTTVTWAHHALREGDREGLKKGLVLTVLLGVFFTSLQVYEYAHAGFAYAGSIYGATFYMATGFHGFHVLVGTIFLAVCAARAFKGHFTPDHHFGLEAAAWYWHFVDVVWIFLFAAIYVWGAAPMIAHH